MKIRNFILVLLFALPILLAAQNKHINKVIQKYKDNKSFTSININPGAFDINPGNNKEAQKANKVLQKIDDILILQINNNSKNYNKFIKEVQKAIDDDGFTEMIQVNEKDEEVGIYMLTDKNETDYFSDFLVFSRESDEASLIYINGLFDMSEMMNIMNEMDVDINIEEEDD